MNPTRRFSLPRLAFRRGRAEAPGDPASDRFHRLILPHLDAAYSYARYLTRDPAAAEDVVQEAFLRAFRALAGCRENEKAWLFAIVRNCHHDLAKKNSRYQSADQTGAEPVDDETPFTLVERATGIAHVRGTIEALPEPFRETVILRELEGLSYRDIADMNGVPIGTVMSRLARGRQMLASLLIGPDTSDKADNLDTGAISR